MTKQLFKNNPDLKKMNRYSKRVAKRLFAKYALWINYARVEQNNQESYLVVEIAAPINPTERDFIFSTYDHRITIHFDWYHAHFGGWEGMELNDSFDNAMGFLDALFAEELIVGIKMEDDQWKGSTMFTPQTIKYIQSGDVSYIRSWLGTFDKNFELK